MKTDDETARASLLQIIRTGTPRQRLDATRELAALDVRSPERRLPDFEDMLLRARRAPPPSREARPGIGPGREPATGQPRAIWSMQTVTARMSASSWPAAISMP